MIIARRRFRSRLLLAVALAIALLFYLRPTRFPDLNGTYTHKPTILFRKSSFDWTTVEQHHPVQSVITLPRGTPKPLPRIQHQFGQKQKNVPTSQARAVIVRNAFLRCWNSYKEHAWLHDELKPITGGAKDTFGGWAATLVDSLDTLWIMGLKSEFYEAAQAAVQLDFNHTTESGINVFETTIRHLGGLLGAYDLSGEPALLLKARELGDMLYMAFDTPNRMTPFWLTFEDVIAGTQMAGTHDPSASPASLSMEFTRLAQLTGDDRYYDAIDRVRAFLERTQDKSLLPGMWPTMINFRDEMVPDNSFSLGALADSLYEYLPKMFILLGGLEPSYESMYRKAMDTVVDNILFRPMLPGKEDILFPGTAFVRNEGVSLVPEGQHLSCFVGGMFAVGGRTFGIDEHVKIGERITRGCAWTYEAFPTGLMPEIFGLLECKSLDGCEWDQDRWREEGDQSLKEGFRNAREPGYLLRPEAIESIFVLYRVTGDEQLRETAWTMFQRIMIASETPFGNAAIANVTVDGTAEKEDSMESFWMAETLKYFYLIFSPADVISLDEWVLNTEAHPFRRPR
ncbi:glycoside hydrolase family 47 protein [Coniochaeta ligniaria NRRL 30616]|uniref:alpha-1,2-Mannosidase n=1 Tax=Coniochaeta ligniaria NRRL 30616 TaxID=1408157 RepID=A0A1J7IBR6_9PEZI|nr:glycoside hydrolase family 47 protein [Coniochaeta ligniaria NRRL 30616]